VHNQQHLKEKKLMAFSPTYTNMLQIVNQKAHQAIRHEDGAYINTKEFYIHASRLQPIAKNENLQSPFTPSYWAKFYTAEVM